VLVVRVTSFSLRLSDRVSFPPSYSIYLRHDPLVV